MYSPFRLGWKYLHYYFTAASGKGHGIHSPFVFDFVTRVMNDQGPYPAWAAIEELRGWLLRDQRLGQLLFRIAHHYQPATVLELGTSLGLSTAYLATGAPGARVISMEGSGPIIETAAENLHLLGVDAELLQGNFDVLLEPLLEKIGPVGLAFVDGNHRYEPTLRYFHLLMAHMSAPAVLIFDDIHWSADMERAWAAIRADSRVYMTIDLFFIGLVFLRDEFKVKQNFTIRF